MDRFEAMSVDSLRAANSLVVPSKPSLIQHVADATADKRRE